MKRISAVVVLFVVVMLAATPIFAEEPLSLSITMEGVNECNRGLYVVSFARPTKITITMVDPATRPLHLEVTALMRTRFGYSSRPLCVFEKEGRGWYQFSFWYQFTFHDTGGFLKVVVWGADGQRWAHAEVPISVNY